MVDGSRTVDSVIDELEADGYEDAVEVIRLLLARVGMLEEFAEEEYSRGYDNGYDSGQGWY